MKTLRLIGMLAAVLWLSPAQAKTVEYSLTIARENVSITGHAVSKITINGGIPGPTLRFAEGDDAVIHVTNRMDETTSVHWHGLLVPAAMDGVPGMNGFPGIRAGETFTYRFHIRQSGTYWYHAHSNSQEQDGHYGSIVIAPKTKDTAAERDYVVVLSDFTEESAKTILPHLKMDSGYYNFHKPTLSDFFREANEKGLKEAWRAQKEWGQMRMSRADLSDVSGYTFLVNGKTPQQNWTGLFKPGERVRLRFINASAMTIYDVRIPGLKMTVVAADGQNVEPVTVDEFRFGNAETYDVIVQPKQDAAYAIAAESIDRTGFAIGTLAPREGMRAKAPTPRKRTLLTMTDMNMEAMMKDDPDMDMSHMGEPSGWADAGTPKGHKALSYADLRYPGTQPQSAKPTREITLRLNGSMRRFIWTINGKKFEDAPPIPAKYGERVRLTFINESMMAHPMHLHGMFMQLENGQPAGKMPNKHTVIVPPGQTVSVLLTANEPGEWPLHCHMLYHMLAGMMGEFVVAKPGEAVDITAEPPRKEHHHAH